MADFPQQHEVHFPGNASPAAGASLNDAPPHPQSAPSYCPLPVPGQPHGYAGIVPDGVFPQANAAGNRRPDDDRDNNPPPVNIAAQGQPQDLQHIYMADYYGVNERPTLHEHRAHVINDYAGVVLDFPPQAQAAAPAPPEEIDNPARHPVARPGHVQAFIDERPDQDPVPNGLPAEILRQLAILYLREPNSQVAMINMEPGHFHGVRIVITLDLATR